MEKDTGSKGGINCIDDLDAKKEKWFAMDGGGKVQFRTITQSEWRSIQKQTVKRKVDYKKVDGTPGRFEYDEINSELQNELFWDASIVSWDGFSFKHPETKAVITCTPESCTRENKLLLVLNSKKFLSFANEAIKELSEDETAQAKAAEKN